ncbi:MAG TPA: pitrilysin family protein, partial [Gemmataceae bacterium]|nr:pitrilysin family protein [Gemmataceae bacterium]
MMRPGFLPSVALAGLVSAVLAYPAQAADPAPAAAPAPQKVVTVEGVTEYHLDNGLRILLLPDPSSARFTVNQCVLVGSRMEGYGEAGMAHLLEHMNFKGTPNHQHIPDDLKNHGAQFNATTSFDRTNYFETLNATDENLDFALNLESDRLIHSFIRHEDLATEMTVVRSEFERGENSPSTVLGQRMMAAAYQWHNYSKDTIGNRSDIERVPIENLQAFYHKWYQPDNVVLMICGKFDPDKALSLVTKY